MKRSIAVLAGFLALAIIALVWLRVRGAGNKAPPSRTIPVPLEVQTCAEARAYPGLVRAEDVRFVECDRTSVPDAQAFKLGDPIVAPSTPSSLDAVEYRPGECANKGGGISTLSAWYRPENVDVAIECSKLRCDAGDAVGCEDLGWLYSDDDLGGLFRARRPSKADSIAAFERGCTLGYAESCLTLAAAAERSNQDAAASRYYELACKAPVPIPRACLQAAEHRIEAGKNDDALQFLLRGCRGTSASSNPLFFADRQGCAILARRAKLSGDMTSYREYLRLECAFGGSERTLAACEELGLLKVQDGAIKQAIAYLRKACGSDPRVQAMYQRSCKTLRQLEHPST